MRRRTRESPGAGFGSGPAPEWISLGATPVTSPNRRKHVRLTGFNNEPMAKLAEQILRGEGIPCYTRSLHGGPGLWGSAYNLPHDISVYEEDEVRAREVLDLPPIDWDQRDATESGTSGRDRRLLIMGVALAILAAAIILQSVGR